MSERPRQVIARPRPSPAELRRLPQDQRDAVLAAQAEEAEEAYRTDPDLSGFDAFGEDEVDGDDPPAETR
jgi:hypothetical protein